MYNEIVACLDGSLFAEKIIPYARGVTNAIGAKLTLLRVVEDEDEFAGAERYVRGLAKKLGAQGRVRVVEPDKPGAILKHLRQNPRAIAAITTHGRSGLLESLLGSVALKIIKGAGRPVLLYRPSATSTSSEIEAEVKIATLVVTLDGSDFSEKILSFAALLAKSLSANLEIVQVLQAEGNKRPIPPELTGDVLESSYLCNQAAEIKRKYEISADWDVLHGNPADAICNYVQGRRDVVLAMTSHAREGVERTLFGSVSSACVRRSGVPILFYWPNP